VGAGTISLWHPSKTKKLLMGYISPPCGCGMQETPGELKNINLLVVKIFTHKKAQKGMINL
jgi:hypothetical protein